MTLAPGLRLGPYEILSPLGAGGMGEVWRARDTRLRRDVAIKVLPAAVAGDAERRSRFAREAQAMAALSHPNVIAVFDTGLHDGSPYIVEELLDGEPLRARLKAGPLPVQTAVEIAVAIARGLDAAHEKGIIHRDLKPENVVLTRQGVVKVLDFGLAKLIDSGPTAETLSRPPSGATEAGHVLGTLGYMAPEQLRGAAVDRRVDIFAFGCVLYEMLAGRPPFARDSAVDTASAILNEQAPRLDTGNSPVSPALARIVDSCLAKRPANRFAAAGDLALTLEAVATGVAGPSVPSKPRRRAEARAIAWGIVAVALTTLLAVAASRSLRHPGQPTTLTVRRLSTQVSPGIVLAGRGHLALSPDGTNLVFVGRREGQEQLYLRPMAAAEASPIAGTSNATTQFFSPDGQWVGFFADGKLRKVPLAGGPPVTVCDATRGSRGSWGADGTIVFAGFSDPRLWRVSEAGGTPQPLTTVDEAHGDKSHGWPQILPAGDAILYVVTSDSSARVVAQRLRSGEAKTLVQDATEPHFSATGHLIYTNAGGIFGVPFDPRALEVTGSPVAIAGQFLQAAVSPAGLLVYTAPAFSADLALVWVDRQGVSEPSTGKRRAYFIPRLAPEGKRVAVGILTGESSSDIWILDLERDVLSRLTFDESSRFPVWTPDGKRVVFSSLRQGDQNLFWAPADGSGPAERLTTSKIAQFAHSFSPDGGLLAFDDSQPGDIWVLPVGERSAARALLHSPFREWGPRFSPDGRWLAYLSDESSRLELGVRRYPDLGGWLQLSADGATEPVWPRSGHEIFYRADERMMAVGVATGPAFSAAKPHLLFEARYEPGLPGIPNYDVTADGQRLLMVQGSYDESTATRLNVVILGSPLPAR